MIVLSLSQSDSFCEPLSRFFDNIYLTSTYKYNSLINERLFSSHVHTQIILVSATNNHAFHDMIVQQLVTSRQHLQE